jgi:hypothetical protein
MKREPWRLRFVLVLFLALVLLGLPRPAYACIDPDCVPPIIKQVPGPSDTRR